MFRLLTTIAFSSLTLFATSVQAHNLSVSNNIESKGTVYRVIDGDTYLINITDGTFNQFVEAADGDQDILDNFNFKYKSIKARLASTNTEESEHKDESRNTDFGKMVSDIMKQLLEGEEVSLKCYDFGRYDRPICNIAIHQQGKSYDVGGYLIHHEFSPYITKYGDNPYLHEEYLQLSQ